MAAPASIIAAGSLAAGSITNVAVGGIDTVTTSWLPLTYGTFVANGATPVTVANAAVTATSIILFGLATVGGTVGAIPAVKTQTAGTGFTVGGTASDTSTYSYLILG